jgi:hypothetical protein
MALATILAEQRARGFLGHISKPLPPPPPKPMRQAWDQSSQVLTSSSAKEAWALKILNRKQEAGEQLDESQLAMLRRLAPGAAEMVASPSAVAAAVAAAAPTKVVKLGGEAKRRKGGGGGGGGRGFRGKGRAGGRR